MQVIRGSRRGGSPEFPPVSSVAVDELTRLFLAARDGDRTALLHAVRASQADVWRLACHLVGADDADDVTQDTFVRAWRALPAFRGDSSARTWLLSIARRACADAVRRTVRRRRLAAPARAAGRRSPARRSTGDPSGAHAVQALVDELARDQRVAFVLTQMVGCSYEEAAEVCGVPVGTIRSRVARAREQLVDDGARGRRPDDRSRRVRLRARVVARARRSASSVASAAPAGAHGLGGLTPTNYETVLQSVTPHVPGLARCTSSTSAPRSSSPTTAARDVVVLGYDGEPYLRVGPRRRVREHALAGDVPQPVDHHHRHAAEVGRREGAAGVAARVDRHHRALARPPRALHGHRRSAGGRARPRPRGTSSTTGRSRCASAAQTVRRARADRLRAAAVAVAVGRSARCVLAVGVFVLARTRSWRTVFVVGARAAHRHRDRARDRAVGRDRPRRPAPSWARAPTRSPGSLLGLLGARVDVAQGRRVGGAARARRHHLPVRRRRPRRRHHARATRRSRARSRPGSPGSS